MIRPILVLACLTLPATAQEVDCADAMAQVDLNACAYQDWEAADAELNAAYQKTLRLMQGWDENLPEDEQGGAEALTQAQRAWITFRDKACAAESFGMKGGSAERMVVYGCMRQLTMERTAHLTGLFDAYAE